MKPTPETIEAHFNLLLQHGIVSDCDADRESAAAALTAALAVMPEQITVTSHADDLVVGSTTATWAVEPPYECGKPEDCAYPQCGRCCLMPFPDPPKETA